MDKSDQDRWTSELLDEVFVAFAHHTGLSQCLVFKGARVLARRLPSAARQSLDIDSNLTEEFVRAHPDRGEQQSLLQTWIEAALRRQFERNSPVRYTLTKVTIRRKPPRGHMRGWDAFEVKLSVSDHRHPTTRAFPAPTIDIAAPESLTNASVQLLEVSDDVTIFAYTLVRQTAEKLRAFLTSLPAYRTKLGGERDRGAIRAKDLYDLAKIARQHPIPDDVEFWSAVGREFKHACETRFVDCNDKASFWQSVVETRATYEQSGVLGDDVPFTEAERVVDAVVALFLKLGILPFEYPLSDALSSN